MRERERERETSQNPDRSEIGEENDDVPMSLVEFERSASKCGENGFYRGDLFGNRLLRVGIKEERG